MADFKIAAVFRAREYSPNHIGNDAAILNEVCDQLRKRGCSVETFSEDRLVSEGYAYPGQYNAWLTMARSPRCVDLLEKMESNGELVINSGYGIENCRRGRMANILLAHNVPFTDFIAVDTDESVVKRLKKAEYQKCWIKQADHHSQHKEDVTFVRHAGEAQEVLQEYFMRGIKRAIICRHLEGDIIRFYGVRGTSFFQWFLPMDDQPYVHDHEVEGGEKPAWIREKELKELCDRAAETLDLKVYGGDCIQLPTGALKLIDVNDWPSFAPCRKPAASTIARMVLSEIKKKVRL
ncbi:MAG: hypothetical protein J1E99_05765 [Muribaculaceae bacterium]|nr:hypothetical protein [Muribaculaceae bacterium]